MSCPFPGSKERPLECTFRVWPSFINVNCLAISKREGNHLTLLVSRSNCTSGFRLSKSPAEAHWFSVLSILTSQWIIQPLQAMTMAPLTCPKCPNVEYRLKMGQVHFLPETLNPQHHPCCQTEGSSYRGATQVSIEVGGVNTHLQVGPRGHSIKITPLKTVLKSTHRLLESNRKHQADHSIGIIH